MVLRVALYALSRHRPERDMLQEFYNVLTESRKQSTGKLGYDGLQDLSFTGPDVTHHPVTYKNGAGAAGDSLAWRVRFELASDPVNCFEVEVDDEVVIGRDVEIPGLVDLSAYNAAALGVSRRHAMLRSTATSLFVVDLGSTNGTLLNGYSIGSNTPYPLTSGSSLRLGELQFVVRVMEGPSYQTVMLGSSLDLSDALSHIARAITSQLNLDEVLSQVAETAMSLTAAGETSIWLLDGATGELFLEAERGIKDEKIRRMRLPIREDTLAGQVFKTGNSLRASRRPGEAQIKVKTEYLVESLVYVPITLAGVTFGVLAAVHREVGKHFSDQNERLLRAIADFAAIAIQNARLYQATDKALARRVKELVAFNEVARTISASLDLNQVYNVLVEQVTKHWPVEAMRLYLLDERKDVLYSLETSDDIPYSAATGIMGKVAKSGQVVVENDVESHPDFDANVDQLDGQKLRSVACVPLRIQGRMVGALALFNKADGRFTWEDVARLQAFANLVATAIENARLFTESEHQRATILATAQMLSQPLLILDEQGEVVLFNQAASQILETNPAHLFAGLNGSVGQPTEVLIGDQTFLCTSEHSPGVGTIVVMQDITYIKQLEQDRADFIDTLSHDLKNPLASIKGYAGLLSKAFPLDEKYCRYVDQIERAIDRMINMINQMLQTGAQASAMTILRQSCDLEQVIAKTLNDVAGAALHKSINVVYERGGHAYPIQADEMRLYHMTLNLVDNSIKYSPENTCVTVKVTFGKTAVTIQVQDEGPGIPAGDSSRIFARYYRGTQANIQPGSGLGLSLVRAIAEAHGGSVAARNLPERGALFTVTLPRLP